MFIVFLMIYWIVGVLRFHIPFFSTVFTIITFPSGLAFRILEDKPSAWWYELFGTTLINDEIAQWLLFVLMVAVQALIYHLIVKIVGVNRR